MAKKMVENHLVKIRNSSGLFAALDGKKDLPSTFKKVAAVIFHKTFVKLCLLCYILKAENKKQQWSKFSVCQFTVAAAACYSQLSKHNKTNKVWQKFLKKMTAATFSKRAWQSFLPSSPAISKSKFKILTKWVSTIFLPFLPWPPVASISMLFVPIVP